MKNEFELTIKYFDKRAIATRRELWNKIADLQSQLQQANEIINNPDTLIFQQQQLIDNLKSQLAEKEEQLNSTQVGEQFALKCCIEAKELLAEKEKEQNQKAIVQLEKLKYTINVNQIDNGYTDEQVDLYELNETIDQQIALLKGESK